MSACNGQNPQLILNNRPMWVIWGLGFLSFSLFFLLNSVSLSVLLPASFLLLSSLFCIIVESFVNEFWCPGWEFALVVCLLGWSLVYKIVVFILFLYFVESVHDRNIILSSAILCSFT